MPEPRSLRKVVGTGTLRLVVSHGWIADSSLWDDFADFLDGDLFSVALVDHRGYGCVIDEQPAGLAGSAADIISVADHLGWERFSVLGHSMGGLVAQLLAVDAADRLDRLVLLSSVPASGAALPPETRKSRRLAVTDPSERRKLITVNAATTDEQVARIAAASLTTTTPETLVHYMEEWSRADFAHLLPEQARPCLVITGRDDPAVRTELMKDTILKFWPRCDLVELGATGHYAMVQAPSELARWVTAFLS